MLTCKRYIIWGNSFNICDDFDDEKKIIWSRDDDHSNIQRDIYINHGDKNVDFEVTVSYEIWKRARVTVVSRNFTKNQVTEAER